MISLLLTIIIVALILGLVFYALQNVPGLPPVVRQVIIVVACLIVILYLLGWLFGYMPHVRFP